MIRNREDLDTLIAEHWRYVSALLESHGVCEKEIGIAQFHYYSAFEHGYKHAVQEMENKGLADVPEAVFGNPAPTYADEYKIDPQDPRRCPTCRWLDRSTDQCGHQFPQLCGREYDWRKWEGRAARG